MKNLITLLIPFILLSFSSLQAQVTQEWLARYNGPRNDHDLVKSLAIDGSGNVYVTGITGVGINADFATIKYNPSGMQQWAVRYNGPGSYIDQANSIAVDDSGNVYVTGVSRGAGTADDYATIKYNSAGAQQWAARYSGQGTGKDAAYSIAVDSLGNVYVTGSSNGGGTADDYATIKYNSAGAQQWVAIYDGPGNSNDAAYSLEVDDSSNVYVTGFSNGLGTSGDYATIKYNSSGVRQWIARYNGPGNNQDEAKFLAVDDSGNVYVTGFSVGADTSDYATIKYNSLGDQEWEARYNGPGNYIDQANSLAVDDSGYVYVTGSSFGIGTADDYATIKYDLSGVEQWVKTYNGPGNVNNYAKSLALDGLGNVYVTGNSYVDDVGYREFSTIKYNSTGVQEWVQIYLGPGSNDDATSIAVDGFGNIYVTGSSSGISTRYDFVTIKYVESRSQPAYTLTVGNCELVSMNYQDDAFEFDIYISHSNPSTVFEYGSGQYVLSFNPRVLSNTIPLDPSDTSLMSYKIVGSDLPLPMQPRNPTIKTITNPPDTVLSLSANTLPVPGNGYIMTGNGFPGTKIVRMRLWNKTGSFNVDSLRLKWINPPIVNATRILAYVGTTVTDVTTANTHLIECSGGALPIELFSFSSGVNRNNITLNWTTATETNNSGFEIERSMVNGQFPMPNVQWSKIGFVKGTGTINSAKNYSFTDKGLNSGKYNYRLKQIDFNGNFEYFNLNNEVEIGVPDNFDLSQNYPNPFNPSTKIDYALPFDGKVSLKLFDVSGRELATLVNEFQTGGYYTTTFNGTNLSSGIYFYRLSFEDNGQSAKSVAVKTKKMALIK